MITTVAVHGFRSLRDLVLPLGPVTLVTGANGTGKSSCYRALSLLAATAHGDLVNTLAHQGGLHSILWAGPETVTNAMRAGHVPVEGRHKRVRPVSLMLGFASDELGYLVDVGLPQPRRSLFALDPEVKREIVFAGPVMRPASSLVRRRSGRVEVRDGTWQTALEGLTSTQSMFTELADPAAFPDLVAARETIRGWRFYDGFRTDADSPARQPQVATWTPRLAPDGSDLPAALGTVLESANAPLLRAAVAAAFPGGELNLSPTGRRLEIAFTQHGLLRPLSGEELSDGTLRFLLLAAALLSPRPPGLLVLNEPETSLHPDVLPALARLIGQAAQRTQVVVVSHSAVLAEHLRGAAPGIVHHQLVKELGETRVEGRGMLGGPTWDWGSR